MKLNILNIDAWNYSSKAAAVYRSIGDYREEVIPNKDALLNRVSEANVLITRLSHHISESVISSAPNLQYIVTNTTGLDHIDLTAASKRGIEIVSLKGEQAFLRSIYATAELSWALLLESCRGISGALWDVRKNACWDRERHFGNELAGKRLGILGFGRIGEKIARYGNAFDMELCAYDPSPISKPSYTQFLESAEALFQNDLDLLSIHIPLSEENKYFVDKHLLQFLAPKTIIINTSRGDVINERHLLSSLRNNELGGYATDVLSGETQHDFLAASKLYKEMRDDPRLIVTPHIGGATYESWEKTELFCANKFAGCIQ